MTLPDKTFCRRCREPIYFFQMSGGKFHPVNTIPVLIKPDTRGTWISEDGYYFNASDPARPKWGYQSHFATCPHAEKFRRKKKGEKK